MKPDQHVVVDVRAIDVGYFSTKFTLGRKDVAGSKVIATGIFPSLAPRLPAGLTPQNAMQGQLDGCVVGVNAVNYYVGRDAILYSGGGDTRDVLPNYSRSDKYLALMRGALAYMFKDVQARSELVIKHLVLGLPLNTFPDHQEHLISRATGEHVLPDPEHEDSMRRITIQKTSVIVQPQGALVTFGIRNSRTMKDDWILVVDPGGGTLDWYVARGNQPNWARSGAYPQCMLACSHAVADRINTVWRNNFEIMERIDNAIRSGAPSFKVAGQEYAIADYQTAIQAVLKEAVDKMEIKLGSLENLDRILFTGGGARVFYDYMKSRYPRLERIMAVDDDSVFANVKGFQVAGEILSRPVIA